MMMVIVLSVMFLGSMQPIMMVLSLIFILLLYSLFLYKLMVSFWYSYALVMVMLSGVFVIFTYMASLSPNEGFEIYSLIFLVLFMVIVFLNKKVVIISLISDFVSLNLWVAYLGLFSLFLVVLLLSVMVMVVWVSMKAKGALRVF
uniref:NADH dehydrogenase subunit 6 n=1 Tax=Argyroneta aquatica TaxID=375087 RepID=A0A0E3DRE6_ARGAQ|nr:NADH dehydrogenase subunit 6 [Argyroneta aquatica]AIL95164.1 NADH dehydrogenase subunit 6 [Argyroneta aquatica]